MTDPHTEVSKTDSHSDTDRAISTLALFLRSADRDRFFLNCWTRFFFLGGPATQETEQREGARKDPGGF